MENRQNGRSSRIVMGNEVKDIVMKGAGPQSGTLAAEPLPENDPHVARIGSPPTVMTPQEWFTLGGRSMPASLLNTIPSAAVLKREGAAVLEYDTGIDTNRAGRREGYCHNLRKPS